MEFLSIFIYEYLYSLLSTELDIIKINRGEHKWPKE
jgi:hypothetical protein